MFHERGRTIGCSQWGELETGIILARWHGLNCGFAAHCALIAFWAVGAVVGSVFGARRSSLTFLGGLAKFQSANLTSEVTSRDVTAFYGCVCPTDSSLASRSLKS